MQEVATTLERMLITRRERAVGRAVCPFLLLMLLCLGATLPLSAEEPKSAQPEDEAYLLWQEGYLLHLLGHYDKAIEVFGRSIAEHPTAEAHTFRGWSLSMLGQLDEAITECKRAIALDPGYGNPYNDIGVYLIDLGRTDEAIPWLKKAMDAKRYCCYQYPHFNMGRVLVMQGRLTEAKSSFERALSYEPDYLPAQRALEYIHEHMREKGQERI
jgi:tetratricopeptide (TPR) repeat protein